MSSENLQAFYQLFRNNETIQSQLAVNLHPQDYAALVVELGKTQGLNFTVAEVQAALDNPNQFLGETLLGDELTDLELEIVAGGTPVNCAKMMT